MVCSPKGRSPAACRANFLVLQKRKQLGVLRQDPCTPSGALDERLLPLDATRILSRTLKAVGEKTTFAFRLPSRG